MPSAAKVGNKPSHITKGSVFDDLALTSIEIAEAKIKSDLWRDLVAHIAPLQLTQKELAEKLDVHQPDVSNLLNGKLSKFSVETFIRYAVKLGLGFEAKFTSPKHQKRNAPSHVAAKRIRGSRMPAGIGV
jgi:predicted XRE-type DNA-binding protein